MTASPGQHHDLCKGFRGPLLNEVLAAEVASYDVLAGDRSRHVIDEMVIAAHDMGHRFVHGASQWGLYLAGAMIGRSDELVPWVPRNPVRVLLIDGCLAGATGLITAASRLRSLGALDVDALAVDLPPEAQSSLLTADISHVRLLRPAASPLVALTRGSADHESKG
ncbi:MAG TPA: hypothetical protein VNU19_20705 [Candidatus Acidoferrum sp.]|jgi:hypothetical protein|nr:hypothetical protein [Candidatus Acidoferrum sp.]